MANVSPATVTVTSTTGPGQSVTSQKFTDVVKIEVDFRANTLKLTRDSANGIIYYDYSAMATLSWTITSGQAAIVVSS